MPAKKTKQAPLRQHKYEIIVRNLDTDLSAAVSERINQGWQLQGGVSVSFNILGQSVFAQAVAKIVDPCLSNLQS